MLVASEKDPSQRVMVVGVGAAGPTPNGLTVEGFWGDIQNGQHGVQRIDGIVEGYETKITTRIGALLPPFNLQELLASDGFDVKQPTNIHKETRAKWDPTAQVQVWTGSQALRQAGILTGDSLRIDENHLHPERFGVYQGTGLAGTLNLINVQKKLDGPEDSKISPFEILRFLGGRVDEVLSIVFNAQAFSDTASTECAAGISVINYAMDDLRLGRADVVLAGGVEIATHPATLAAFEATNALHQSPDPKTAPLMFGDHDNYPTGLVFGAGGGNVVLETLEHVRWRQEKLGAKVVILAEVLGTGKSADAYHDTSPGNNGSGRAIDSAFKDAGRSVQEIENLLVMAHATGTGPADIDEFMKIVERFKRDQVVGISSIKVDTGHTFAASGTLSLIAGIMGMRDNYVPGFRTMTATNRAPATRGWPFMEGRGRNVPNVGMILVNAFGFGGKNRVALLGPGEINN